MLHRSGFWLIIKGNILEFSPQNHVRWWLDWYSKVWNMDTLWRLLDLSSYVLVFYIPPQILDNESPPAQIPRGLYYFDLPNSQQAKSTPLLKTLSSFPRSIFPLKNFTLPDGLTTRWHVDCSVTCDGNLERIDAENICPWHKCQHVYTQNRWFFGTFSRAYGPSTWRRYVWTEQFQSRSLHLKRNKETY